MGNVSVKVNKPRAGKAKRVIFNIIMVILSVLMLYPLIYILLGALSGRAEYMEKGGILPIPRSWQWSRLTNFTIIFEVGEFYPAVGITLLRIAFYAVVTIGTSTIGGYLFAKARFTGKKFMFAYIMSAMMIPSISIMVPSFILLAKFPLVGGNSIIGQGGTGFMGNVAVLFVTGWVGSYNIFLMRQCMLSSGDDFKEAAQIDGAGTLRIIFQIYFPLTRPVIAVMLIGLFIGFWNDYMTCLIYLSNRPEFYTIGTKIVSIIKMMSMQGFDTIPNYPRMFGMSLIFMMPPIISFLIFQRQFISGLSLGGLKG